VLGASSGSVSSSTRQLLATGIVEKVSLPRERRDYFRIAPGGWWEVIGARLVPLARKTQELMEEGIDVLTRIDAADRTERLAEVRDVYAFVEREIGAVLARAPGPRSEEPRSVDGGRGAPPRQDG
jgi:DNA-binding transcriptional regulator GbsR (MarR family)